MRTSQTRTSQAGRLPAGKKTQNRPELCISHEISVIGEFHGYRFNNGNFAVLKAKIISVNPNGGGANGKLPVEGKMITIVGTFPDNIFYNGTLMPSPVIKVLTCLSIRLSIRTAPMPLIQAQGERCLLPFRCLTLV